MKVEEIYEKELKDIKIPIIDILRARRNISKFLVFNDIDDSRFVAIMQRGFNKGIDSYDTCLLKWLFDYSKGIDIFKLKGDVFDDKKANVET